MLATITCLHWLTATPDGFDLLTDHNNLDFIFDPLSLMPDLSESSVRKVLRWAIRLSTYNYVCLHIHGGDNVWADLLSRWSAPPISRRLLFISPFNSASDVDFESPTVAKLVEIQVSCSSSRPAQLQLSDGLWQNSTGAFWVPDSADNLQLRLCIISHTSAAGHRGCDSTERALSSNFFWTTLTSDVQSFDSSCLHCISTTGGNRIPRPFGPSVHVCKPNDLIQFDYLELGAVSTGDKYVLMLPDDHSSHSRLFPFSFTSTTNAAHALIDW